MAVIKTAILQTHVYTEKSRNIIQAKQKFLPVRNFRGIDLAVLPEMFCCPYENKYFPEYAESEGGDTWEKCSRLAKRTWDLSHSWKYAGERRNRSYLHTHPMFLTETGIRSGNTGRCIFLTLM